MKNYLYLLLPFILLMTSAFAAEPSLYIKSGKQEQIYTRTQLLNRPDVTTITTTDDPVFPGKTIVYQAVPAAALFKGFNVSADAIIQFQTLDHFSAPINEQLLMNTSPDAALAYIAIERAGEKWPPVKPGVDERTSAPFYLIWKNPAKSRITMELWVMQLSGFTIDAAFAKMYPHVQPDQKLAADDPVMLGFKVFKTNCFACHTLNREGNSKIGPDLNVPHNPTEYFAGGYLRKLIRNPQNLRYWPQSKMKGFSISDISEAELDDLLVYLKYMSKRKNSQ